MRFALAFIALSFVPVSTGVCGCYGSRSQEDGRRSGSQLASRAGDPVQLRAGSGGGGSVMVPGDGPLELAGQPGSSDEPAGPAPERSGSGGCGAYREPFSSNTADASAFSGVGGAGFQLVGICDRCGLSHQTDQCRSLVYSVPTIEDPNYYPCLDISLEYVDCLERESCICSGEVPKACAPTKAELDACLAR